MSIRTEGEGIGPDAAAFGSGAGVPVAELEFSLIHALQNTGVCVIYQDAQMRVAWAENSPADWNAGDLRGLSDDDFLPHDEAQRLLAVKHAILAGGEPRHLELKVVRAGADRWFEFWVDADRHPDGSIRGIVTTALDITEQKRREHVLRALLREVSHRSRNLLAIIQSVATQTGRYSGTIDGFLDRFRGRIQSLAASQDLVTLSNWRGARLYELVIEQVARYCEHPSLRVDFDGENPHLSPNAALHVGLGIHELVVNSVSYGALSRPEGRIALSCLRSPHQALELVWAEETGADLSQLRQKRFGGVALERIVPASLGGSGSLRMDGGKLEYRLLIPAPNFETH